MFGSIFYNLWGALLGFTVYFFVTLNDAAIPLNSIISSLIAAAASFLLMYPVRLLLGYCLYTPDDELFQQLDQENKLMQDHLFEGKAIPEQKTSTVEFGDQSTEEIAKVVQTMMNQDLVNK